MPYSGRMDKVKIEQAPDISPGYPSKGRIIGPAWNHAWHLMAEADRPLSSDEIAATVAKRRKVAVGTVKNLLTYAYKAGMLIRTTELVEKRNRAMYAIDPNRPQ